MRTVVDVSHWQKPEALDYAGLKADGVTAVMVKLSQGNSYVDPVSETHAAKAAVAGLLVGAYHFVDPQIDGASQADHFRECIDELGTGLTSLCPVWLDVESTPGWDAVDPGDRVKRFAHLIIELEKDGQYKAGIYTGTPFWNSYFAEAASLGPEIGVNFAARPLWIAAYHNPEVQPTLPKPWTEWSMWQYTDKGVQNLDTSFAKW